MDICTFSSWLPALSAFIFQGSEGHTELFDFGRLPDSARTTPRCPQAHPAQNILTGLILCSWWLWSIFFEPQPHIQGKYISDFLLPLQLGNGRNTVSRVLFRRRELTEPHWVLGQTRWVLRKTRWVCFGAQIICWEELAELFPRNSVGAKSSLSSVFETVLSETVFGPFPNNPHPPPHPDKPPRPSHPRGLDFGPFQLRLAPFVSDWLRFASVSGPFRVRRVGSGRGRWEGLL